MPRKSFFSFFSCLSGHNQARLIGYFTIKELICQS